jgi:hypothetical protein
MSWTLTPIRKYLVIFGLCLGVVPLIGLINLVFLMNAGEFESIDQIIKFQSQHDALYYSALRPVSYPYKLSLFHHVKPRIVALGASRVWQIHSQYFTGPFVNMGGAMASFQDGEAILRKMAASHKPEVVIMGIDPWWFGSAGIAFRMGTSSATGREFQLDMLFMPCNWLIRQKLSYQDYFKVLLGKSPSPIPAIGVTAVTRMDGFYKDGSYYDLGLVTGFHNLVQRRDITHVGLARLDTNRVANTVKLALAPRAVAPCRELFQRAFLHGVLDDALVIAGIDQRPRRRTIRKGPRRNEIAADKIERVHFQLGRDSVHHPLDREIELWAAEATHRPGGAFVRDDDVVEDINAADAVGVGGKSVHAIDRRRHRRAQVGAVVVPMGQA